MSHLALGCCQQTGKRPTLHQKGTQTQKRELPSNLFNLRCLQSGGEYSTIQSYSFLVRSLRLKPILDLSKAFDSVPHERLLLKLNRHGIDGPLLLWFRNFLKNRQQRVTIRGTFSNWSPVTSGVPQGTILGPTLFLLYVNDIPNVVSSSIKLFADDTKIYREINNAEDTLALQSDLDCLENWTRSWQVKFNPQKCEAMRITYKQDKSKHPYHLSNTELKLTRARTWVFTCQETYPGRAT